MKPNILFRLVLILVSISNTLILANKQNITVKNELSQDWYFFKKVANIESKNTSQDLQWRKKWEENYDFVNRHNLEKNYKRINYELKLNDLSYMSKGEFLKKKTGLKISKDQLKLKKRRYRQTKKERRQTTSSKIPEEYDSRTIYPIPVRDQGDCGGCYAFSAVASIEFQLAKKNLVSLSEQNLVDCTRRFGNYGCLGGTMDQTFDYIKSNKGINLLNFYPYIAKEGKCNFRSSYIGAKVRGYRFIETEEEIEEAVYKYGAISCGIDASLRSFRLYSSGIYNDTMCSKKDVNHAINVIGYTKDYFICRNSWGDKWGINGYFYLPKGINACGLTNYCLYPIL